MANIVAVQCLTRKYERLARMSDENEWVIDQQTKADFLPLILWWVAFTCNDLTKVVWNGSGALGKGCRGHINPGLVNDCLELGHRVRIFILQVAFNVVPQVFNWIYIRTIVWPVCYARYMTVFKPLSNTTSSVGWGVILMKDGRTWAIKRILQVVICEFIIIIMVHLHFLVGQQGSQVPFH